MINVAGPSHVPPESSPESAVSPGLDLTAFAGRIVVVGPPVTYRRSTEIRPADRREVVSALPELAEGGAL